MMVKGSIKCSQALPACRLIAGLTLAPLLGPLLYYFITVLVGSHTGVNQVIANSSLPVDPAFIKAGVIVGGFLFYAPAVLFGFAIMIIMRHLLTWNLFTCVAGALINAFMVSAFFAIILFLFAPGQMMASTGFLMLMKLIYIPAILAGLFFWAITVFKNDKLENALETLGVYKEEALST